MLEEESRQQSIHLRILFFLFAEVKMREQDETKIFGGNHVDSYSYSASTKVSAVTSVKCKALKSSKWVYSKKYKRLILKNNKEA